MDVARESSAPVFARFSPGLVLLAGALVFISCTASGGEDDDDPLQSACVRSHFDDDGGPRTLKDGERCTNVSLGPKCGDHFMSDCIHDCAFDVCQRAPCSSDASCTGGTCEEYVVSGRSYGRWCKRASATSGANACSSCRAACSGVAGCSCCKECKTPCYN